MILVLTAGFGDGHNTAARSVAEALQRLVPEEEVQVTDLVSEVIPRVAAVLKKLYQQAITHFPSGWRRVYRFLEKSEVDPQDSTWLAPLARGLRQRIEQQQPRLIISTYPAYAGFLESLREAMPVPPLVTIITDSISIHSIWVAAPSDLYCVADEETRVVVEGMGVAPEKIRVTGFPVSLQFTEPLPADAHPPGTQRILYLPSTTARRVAATLRALHPLILDGAHLTIPVGKHGKRLYQVLRRFIDSVPEGRVEVIGWTHRIPELLRTHDVAICKAGGAILHEVLAAQIPAVIDYVVPGQEEGNAQMLVSHHCGIRTQTARETAQAVSRILADGGRLGQEMRAQMRTLSVPDAAMRAAQAVLAAAG